MGAKPSRVFSCANLIGNEEKDDVANARTEKTHLREVTSGQRKKRGLAKVSDPLVER